MPGYIYGISFFTVSNVKNLQFKIILGIIRDVFIRPYTYLFELIYKPFPVAFLEKSCGGWLPMTCPTDFALILTFINFLILCFIAYKFRKARTLKIVLGILIVMLFTSIIRIGLIQVNISDCVRETTNWPYIYNQKTGDIGYITFSDGSSYIKSKEDKIEMLSKAGLKTIFYSEKNPNITFGIYENAYVYPYNEKTGRNLCLLRMGHYLDNIFPRSVTESSEIKYQWNIK